VIFVDLDVYRYVFGAESKTLCNYVDFEKLGLPEHWYYDIRKDGTGRKIKFPVQLSVRFAVRKTYVKSVGRLVLKTSPKPLTIGIPLGELRKLDPSNESVVEQSVKGRSRRYFFPVELLHQQMKRTLEQLNKQANQSNKTRFGTKDRPLLNIESDHYLPDELHLMLRITDVLSLRHPKISLDK
jgi:hypothetical protein